ncbi:helix-turn-helix domain-containing protein [Lentibacter sp. XHP0401]|uniref:helix-turn-helix domain-containing protein n=1 Tax=Lentibacter sp. XHP0401 TaxID=2984334 RepID=UPI0021E82692|nr:helix-turn-helix domain-containing protein [Lentibacter sp. XHP0401]MCV2892227.1 helix-turn-helix domain-containing protein [Lentibacter sp. XHP0401]
MTKLTAITPRPLRMRAALRTAIDLRVKQGMTIAAACEEAGMSPQGFHKAMKRPAVRDYLQAIQLEFVAGVEGNKAVYKARALEVGMDLMLNSKSETVRARMVEFFASDGKVSPVSVHIDARQTGGYEYAHPDRQVVEIIPSKAED